MQVPGRRHWATRRLGQFTPGVIKINASGSTSVNVSGFFDNGTTVKNHYDSTTATVSGGAVTFTAANGVVLVEKAD